MNSYSEDVQRMVFAMPEVDKGPEGDFDYRWLNYETDEDTPSKGLDEKGGINDGDKLDGIIENFHQVIIK